MKPIKPILLITFTILLSCQPQQKTGLYNILDYEVNNDSITMNTQSIQRLIDQVHKNGGGTIQFPAGNYFTGTIELKSDVYLELLPGCTIIGSPHIKDYPDKRHDIDTRMNRMSEPKSLIFAMNQENIGILGRGKIDFNGTNPEFDEITNIEKGRKIGKEGLNRPFGMRFVRCKNVELSGVTFSNSAYWMQRFLECSFIHVDNIKVYNPCRANADGIDFDGCDHVTVTNSYFNTADDALCFKTESMRTCEYVTVSNCKLSCHTNCIKMGTGSLMGFKNFNITNCAIEPKLCDHHSKIVGDYISPVGANTISGISLEIVDGGTMENINISNISIDSVETPIFIKLGDMGRVPDSTYSPKPPGKIRNININGITATRCGKLTSSITGIPGHCIENITLSNMVIEMNGGVKMEDVHMPIPENKNHYPESFMFESLLPASGFYLRHVKNITLENITFLFRKPDERPLIVEEDVEGHKLKNVIKK